MSETGQSNSAPSRTRPFLFDASVRCFLSSLIVLLFVALISSCARKPSASDDVNAAFQKYRTSLLEGDGEAAWSVLDLHTQNFYSAVLEDALLLPKRDLNRLNLVHKFTVLRLRADLRKGELQNLTGRDVLVMAVQNGWISKSSVEAMTNLHKVSVKGHYASGFVPEFPDNPVLFFIKEGTEWKISLFKSFELVNATMRQWQTESQQSEKDYLTSVLRQVSKYEVDDRIWDGPLD